MKADDAARRDGSALGRPVRRPGSEQGALISQEQREVLRHALGYGHRGAPGWRNHFVTGPGTDDYATCESLVNSGLMTKRPGTSLSGWDTVYAATEAGKAAARSKAA